VLCLVLRASIQVEQQYVDLAMLFLQVRFCFVPRYSLQCWKKESFCNILTVVAYFFLVNCNLEDAVASGKICLYYSFVSLSGHQLLFVRADQEAIILIP